MVCNSHQLESGCTQLLSSDFNQPPKSCVHTGHPLLCELPLVESSREDKVSTLCSGLYYSGHPLARMLISELRHCQHVTVLVFVRWPCNVSA